MSDKFEERLIEALTVPYQEAKHYIAEYMNDKLSFNERCAELFKDLIYAFALQYDFIGNKFNCEKVNKKALVDFGYPSEIHASISDKKWGTISLDYGDRVVPLKSVGEPDFMEDSRFNLGLVNAILEKDRVYIEKNSIDAGGYGSNCVNIRFDAESIINLRDELISSVPSQYQKFIK